MVRDRLSDGKRIAQLLASELDGHGGALAALSVGDADPGVEPTTHGAFAFAVTNDVEGTEARLAEVYVHPDRARVEFLIGPAAAADAARDAGLRVRPKAVRPPRTLMFVEDGAEVKRALAAFEAASAAGEDDQRERAGDA